MANKNSNVIKPVLIVILGLLATALIYRAISSNLDAKRHAEFESLAESIVIKIQDEIDLQKTALAFFGSAFRVSSDLETPVKLETFFSEVVSEDLFFESFRIKAFYEKDYYDGKFSPETVFEYSKRDIASQWENPLEEWSFLNKYFSPPPLVGGEKLFFRKGGGAVLYKNLDTTSEGINKYLVAEVNIIDHLPAILFDAAPDWLDLHLFYRSEEELKDFLSGVSLQTVRKQVPWTSSWDKNYDIFIPDAINIFGETISVLIRPSSAAYFQTYAITKTVIVLLGVVVTLLLAMWNYSVEVRRKKIEELVELRTSELVESNNLLVEEQAENYRLLEELKVSQQELGNIADSVAGVLFEYDYTNKKFGYVTRKVENILGLSKGQALSLEDPFKTICHPEDFELLNKSLSTCAASGEVCNVEFRALRDGEDIWLRSIGTPVFHDQGEVRFNGVMLDITAFKRLAKERGDIETQLRQAQKMEAVGQLAAGIAHEINTPAQFVGDNIHYLRDVFGDIRQLCEKATTLLGEISSNDELYSQAQEVLAYAREIDMEFLAGDIPQSLEQSLDGIRRIAEIVGAMKEFSHPGGKEKEVINLNRAINNTITVARNEWKYVADVKTDFTEGLPGVAVFPGEFNQVILNMIVNAAHAIAEKNGKNGGKGSITIATGQEDGLVQVSIADDGKGIPPENREKIFDPFFTTKEVGKGTGQGLSMAFKTIVEGHQGSITVDSDVGVGTKFTIKLPVEAL